MTENWICEGCEHRTINDSRCHIFLEQNFEDSPETPTHCPWTGKIRIFKKSEK